MKININKEMVKTAGTVAGKIGKAIVIEGIKGVLLKSATKVISTSFDGGIEGVKALTIDDYVGRKKKHIDVLKEESNKEKVRVEIDADFVEVIRENETKQD